MRAYLIEIIWKTIARDDYLFLFSMEGVKEVKKCLLDLPSIIQELNVIEKQQIQIFVLFSHFIKLP
jgi:hypothetical protein